MNEMLNGFVENVTQCWGCAIFDNLFNVVSSAGVVVYNKIADICFVIFGVLFAFYVVWAVFKYINPKKPDTSDKYYAKTVIRVVINSLFALALLGIGVGFPRFITRVTFEPVANVTLLYTQSVLKTTSEFVNEHVRNSTPVQIKSDGFYRPELRDTIVMLMKTTITQFQSYMKLGIAVIDKSFTWAEMPTLGAIFRHIIMFLVGLYLLYGFFKLFIRFCFYFVDVIVHMALFAFLFPIALVMMAFRGGDMPEWMSTIGRGLGTDQIKKLLGAIVSLGAAVITYLIILVIIARFFSDSGISDADLMKAITSGAVFESDLSGDNLATITLVGAIVLLYVLNYISNQIPQVKKMILGAFGATEENKLSEQMANDAEKLVGLVTNSIKSVGEKIINPDKKPDEDKIKK
jgi:hypothetical protein